MIETNGLTKYLGGRTVVSDVTFRCEPGTVTGFVGPNGAGKTTTMRMLVGLSDPDSGEAVILGGRHRGPPQPRPRGGVLLRAAAQPSRGPGGGGPGGPARAQGGAAPGGGQLAAPRGGG